jgi:ATP-dependent DNA helicase RecG
VISSTSVTTSSASRTSGEDPLTRSPRARLAGPGSVATPTGASPLDAQLLGLPGAGPVTARRLAAHGLETVRDLLLRLPRAYDDLRRPTPLAQVSGGASGGAIADGTTVLVRGVVRRLHVFPRRLLDVVIEGDGSTLRARWFRPPPGMSKGFVKGSEVALAGPVHTDAKGVRELVHPTNVTAALAGRAAEGLGLRPRYAALEGVGGRVVERIVSAALARVEAWALAHVEAASDAEGLELFSAEARARLGVPGFLEALRALHAPADDLDAGALVALLDGSSGFHRRLALEALVTVQLAFLLRRARAGEGGAPPPLAAAEVPLVLGRLRAALGFSLTPAQARAIDEIARDLSGARPMQRLLVGDVGSGKTAVAFAAAALVAAAGGQTLMMVPTEVLAEQHARTLGPLAARLGFRVELLTAGTPAAARKVILAEVAAGRAALVVGTQATLDPALVFPELRLVIVDEQHRFGVSQRAAARRRGAPAGAALPHLLVLSATPIPRTLALARHGDLDASVLGERPAGRRAPATRVCRGADEKRAAYDRLRDELGRGHQAFVVCHVRERARRVGAVTAIGHYGELRRRLAPARVGLLHGALASSEKERVLRAFAAGALDVLVATTVVELGLDVPNATLMIVEDADRFGLAQLHQLRGRVGRGDAPGLCLLCASDDAATSGDGAARLETLASTTDGFELAEADLEARGPGDLFGPRQTGAPTFGPSSLREAFALVELARREAERALAADPDLARAEHAGLASAARALEARRALFEGEAS